MESKYSLQQYQTQATDAADREDAAGQDKESKKPKQRDQALAASKAKQALRSSRGSMNLKVSTEAQQFAAAAQGASVSAGLSASLANLTARNLKYKTGVLAALKADKPGQPSQTSNSEQLDKIEAATKYGKLKSFLKTTRNTISSQVSKQGQSVQEPLGQSKSLAKFAEPRTGERNLTFLQEFTKVNQSGKDPHQRKQSTKTFKEHPRLEEVSREPHELSFQE